MADQQMNPYAQMLQMMGAGATTDQLTQQALLQRRLDLANALTQQGMTPMEGTQMAGQVAIKNSPLQGIAKIAQILGGNYTANNLMRQQIESRASMLGGMRAPGAPDQTPQGPMPNGGTPVAQSIVANPNANAVTGAMAAAPQPSPPPMPTYDPLGGYSDTQRLAAYLADGGKQYNELHAKAASEAFSQRPDVVKLAQFAGDNPAAAAHAKNAIDLSPVAYVGNNLTDRRTGAVIGAIPTLPQAAQFGNGRDANGMPTSIVPTPGGADAEAAIKAATGYGEFLGKPFTYKDANGKEVTSIPNGLPTVAAAPLGANGRVTVAGPNPQESQQRQSMGNSFNDELQSEMSRRNGLAELDNALVLMHDPNAKSGVLASTTNPWVQKVAALFPDSKIANGADAYGVLLQHVANATGYLAPPGKTGDAASAEAARKMLPSPESLNLPALENATRYFAGQVDAGLAHTQYMKANGATPQNPDSINAVHQKFMNTYNPDYFTTLRQTPVTAFPKPEDRTKGMTVNLNGVPFKWAGNGWEHLNAPK